MSGRPHAFRKSDDPETCGDGHQTEPLPPPSAADRVLSPSGTCLEFGCDCEDGRHHR